ncbi:ArsR/SmtB family transcription factor [Streptomyces sp. NBC_01451]|uniref:ArsR/SmtB family transcription factor n=1 Tax=Streptomyces sp. NBC_01451 TaxID=2903872 RepID=UPI002E3813F8|nr:helix-turn-helix domain-containing protein [Streptomyces sp. NBC_01451]
MLRIHFTDQDLQNIRIAPRPDPLWELVCSVCRLQTRQGPLDFGPWRHRAYTQLRSDPALRGVVSQLRTVIPDVGYIPDFLTPPVIGGSLGDGLDQILRTPRGQLVRELTRLAESRPGSSRTESLAEPGADGLKSLTGALHTYHRALLGPYWADIRTQVGSDVALRARSLLDGGTQSLLNGLRPLAQWNPPVLEVDYPVDRDLHLGGRGLLLLPSYFCWRRPTALADPSLAPVLVYPVKKTLLSDAYGTRQKLVHLLGRTRAALLAEAAGQISRTTSELADAVRVSLPSVSAQLSILRDTGLVVSRREGKYVLHSVTPLGLQLLGAQSPGPGPAEGSRG